MRNIETSISGDVLTIKVNLKEPGAVSASGKSVVIASTEGNVSIPGAEHLKLGVNLYTPAPSKK